MQEKKGKFRKIDIRELKNGDELNYVYDVAPRQAIGDENVQEVFHRAKTIYCKCS
jgi:hypothetical protein